MRRSATLLLVLALGAQAFAAAPVDEQAPQIRAFFANWRPATELVHVNVFVDDREHGGSTITEIAVTIDGEPFDVLPIDGAYDGAYEEVDGDLTPPAVEQEVDQEFEVCAWAFDAAGNATRSQCVVVSTADQAQPGLDGKPLLVQGDTAGDAAVVHGRFVDPHGESVITAARATLDGGDAVPMSAWDGAFDEPTEVVEVDLGPLALGSHRICLYATDAAGNDSMEHVGIVIGDGTPYECVDVEVADRHGPDLSPLTAPDVVGIGQELELVVTADDRRRGGSDLAHAVLTVDGVRRYITRYSPVDEGPVSAFRVRVDGFPELGAHELCLDVTDTAGRRSEPSCATIEVVPRALLGSASMDSMSGHPTDATFAVAIEEAADGTTAGRFTYDDGVVSFTSTSVERLSFHHGTAFVTGRGFLHGVVPCRFQFEVVDQQHLDATSPADTSDIVWLMIDQCGGVMHLLDGTRELLDGDLEVRA